jgi:hypothetical protein
LELGAILLGHLAPPLHPLSKARKEGGRRNAMKMGRKRKKKRKNIVTKR